MHLFYMKTVKIAWKCLKLDQSNNEPKANDNELTKEEEEIFEAFAKAVDPDKPWMMRFWR